jgi:hypothetical protein
MKVLRLGAAVIGMAAGGVRATGQVATVVVPDAPSCAKCTIDLRTVVSLGAVDGPGSLSTNPSSIRVDARGRYWVTQEAELPMVFDGTGKFVKSIGSVGEGPGEFRAAYATMPLSDSVLVFDYITRRATMVGSDLRPGRTIAVPPDIAAGTIITWPTLAFMRKASWGRNEARDPVARVRFSPAGIDVLGSFGPAHDDPDPGYPLAQIFGEVRLGNIWSADANSRYRLSQWSVAAAQVQSLERKPEWFVNPSDGSKRSMAAPYVRAIQEDSAGLIWVFVSVSRPGWREAMPKLGPGANDIPLRNIAFERLYRTTVEVIDPRTAHVVTQRVLDEWIVAALPNGRAAAYSVDEQGTPRIKIVQLSLLGR